MTRKLLVTSALPYANGDIHLGHLLEHIQTDIFVRFQNLIGNEAVYLCADDAHGTAIMISAEKQDRSPEEYIEEVRENHIRDLTGFGVNYGEYYSTHSPENEALSQEFFLAAKEKGAIHAEDVSQYYCESRGMFLADRQVKGTCPSCGAEDQYGDSCEQCFATYRATELINPYSVFSNETPVIKSSKHLFFKVSQFTEVIQDWLAKDTVNPELKGKVNEWFDAGLKDWDISRDAPYFGFEIPGETDKYFYVWLDAPVGYVATTQKWAEKAGKDWNAIWKPGEYEIHHFIGKDILYFHTLFWPAMLHAAEYQLPTKVNVHGFITVNGEKMSKSRGTFITAKHYLDCLDPELLRYYYATKLSGTVDDMDLNLEDFMFRVNSDLVNKLLNIGSRLGKILQRDLGNKVSEHDADGATLIAQFDAAVSGICDSYENLQTNKAMNQIIELAEAANKYIHDKEPWNLIKEDEAAAQAVCTAGINALRRLAILLSPVIPQICEKIYRFLNIEGSPQLSDFGSDLHNTEIQPYEHILKRLKPEDVDQLIQC